MAEIQQTSDITYRIYDYNRVDKVTGKTRELHNDLALDVINFEVQDYYKTNYDKTENQSNQLIHSDYFKSNIINLTATLNKDYSNIDSFIIYVCTKGSFEIALSNTTYIVKKGETILVPACMKDITLKPHQSAEILEVYY